MDKSLPPARSRWPLYAALLLAMLAATLSLAWWAMRDEDAPQPKQARSGPTEIAPLEVEFEPYPGEEPPKDLADIFQAVTGHRIGYEFTIDGETREVWPLKIIELPFSRALLTSDEIRDGCHACPGTFGIYYFQEKGGKTIVTGRWPDAIEGWGWGKAPEEWRLTDRFTTFPAIFASGDFMGQGITLKSATLTELRPDGPVPSDLIGTGYDDTGKVETGRRTCVVKGEIANVRKDAGFDVVVTGSVKSVDRYRKNNDRFTSESRINWDDPCRPSKGSRPKTQP